MYSLLAQYYVLEILLGVNEIFLNEIAFGGHSIKLCRNIIDKDSKIYYGLLSALFSLLSCCPFGPDQKPTSASAEPWDALIGLRGFEDEARTY